MCIYIKREQNRVLSCLTLLKMIKHVFSAQLSLLQWTQAQYTFIN